MTAYIYKILRAVEWASALNTPDYSGSADDIRSGFVHFSTRTQLAGTARKYFAGEKKVKLLAFTEKSFPRSSLKWEPSRNGALFPHLYAGFDVQTADHCWTLDIPAADTHALVGPDDFNSVDFAFIEAEIHPKKVPMHD